MGTFSTPTINDYHIEETNLTLQDYAVEKDNKICYIDWYEDSVYIYSQQFILNDTKESICFYEQAVLEDDIFCHLYVTDNITEVDVLSLYNTTCSQTSTMANVTVKWNIDSDISYIMFEFNNYKYYLKVEGSVDQTYLFELINRLIESK